MPRPSIELPVPANPRRPSLLTLPHHKLHPIVRIAHRQHSILNIAPRIILDHELVLILRGTGRLTYHQTATRFAPHHLFFLEPFIPHHFESDTTVEHIAVHFDFAPNVPPTSLR